MVEVVANLHMHTRYSDGELFHDEIAEAADKAGVNVVITTDHNVYVRQVEGYCGNVLLLVGEEVHDNRRQPQANHCLIYNANDEMIHYAGDPQKLVNEVTKRNGMAFFAHPFEYGARILSDYDAIQWEDWYVQRNTGIEIWNYMTECKASLINWPAALLLAFMPSLVISGPFKATLKKWDELLARGERIVGIGGADAHGAHFHVGPIRKTIFPYEYLFKCVNTHLLLERPFRRDFAHDRQLVYDALRGGHCFVGYDLIAPTRGFSFTAYSGTRNKESRANIGDDFQRGGATIFEVICPSEAEIRLIRNGQVVAATTGRGLKHTAIEPGAYRVECYKRFRLAKRGWIFSNPIYVK